MIVQYVEPASDKVKQMTISSTQYLALLLISVRWSLRTPTVSMIIRFLLPYQLFNHAPKCYFLRLLILIHKMELAPKQIALFLLD